jgi:RNA polymerase sigma factor (sigma-70 family)
LSAAESSQPDGKLDQSVVAALYEAHEAELRRMLLGVLRDHQLAGDVLHVTFTKVMTQGHTAREETRKAWLFRVAYHEAMAVLRRRTTGDRIVRRLAWTQDLADEAAETGMIREESVAAVREVIASLPPEQQQVVRMRVYEEKTFAQISQELKIPLGTALGRMRTAMEKMRVRLDQQHGRGDT